MITVWLHTIGYVATGMLISGMFLHVALNCPKDWDQRSRKVSITVDLEGVARFAFAFLGVTSAFLLLRWVF